MSNREILLELLKQSLGERLSKLEKNEKEADASLKLIKTSYDGFTKKISSLVKLREEKISKEKAEEIKKHQSKQIVDSGKNKKKEIVQKPMKRQLTAAVLKKPNDKILEKKINNTNNITNNTNYTSNNTSTITNNINNNANNTNNTISNSTTITSENNKRINTHKKMKSSANLGKLPTTRPRGKSHVRLNTEISGRNTIGINSIPNNNNIKKKQTGIKKEKDSILDEVPRRNTIGGLALNKKGLRPSKSMGRLINKPSLKKPNKKKDAEEIQKMVNNITIENKEEEEEIKIEEPKVEILPPTLDTCLNKGILEKSILQFLTTKEKMILFNSNKSFAKLNINILKDTISYYEEIFEIYVSENIDDKIKSLEEKYTQEELNSPIKNFQLSRGALKALSLLDSELYLKIFTRPQQEKKLEEIINIYRIFTQFLKLDDLNIIKDDKLYWEKFSKYVLDNIGEKYSEFWIKSGNNFDFSDKTIFQVKKMAKGINEKLKPKYWGNICGTTGFVVFMIKDALEYSGVIEDKKTQPNRIKKNYLYVKSLLEQLNKFVNFFEGLCPKTE